jgi:hypothetical protein
MTKLVYEFAKTDGGEEQGFNDQLISHFLGNVSYYLARESIQNITDASEILPVRAEFQVVDIKSHDLPNWKDLLKYITLASQYEPNRNNDKAKKFYKHAYDILSNDQYVRILKISDYNTRGMGGGEEDRNGDYFKFFKSVGISNKETGRGGSWGLGKGAYFAASHLRTVFVSSIYGDGEYMFAGKVRLNSFVEDRVAYQAHGWYGMEGKEAVRDNNLIPELFRRNEKGTSFFIVAFNEYGSWKEEIIRSVLNNFWPAIAEGNLEVSVDGNLIDSGSLDRFLMDRYSKDTAHTDSSPNPYPFYLAYKNEPVAKINNNLLGEMRLYTINGDGFNNIVAYSRQTGMVVQTKQKYGPKKHMSFFYCAGDEGNELLRNMENPTHNKWDPENIDDMDTELKEAAKKAKKDIDDFIKETLRNLAGEEKAEILEIKGLEDLGLKLRNIDEDSFLPSEMNGESIEKPSDEETGTEVGSTDNEEKTIKRLLKPVRIPIVDIKIEEGEEEEITGEGSHGKGERIGGRTGDENEEGVRAKPMLPIKYRSFATSVNGKVLHSLIIKDVEGEKADISIYAVTDSGLITLPIKSAKVKDKDLITDRNKIVGWDPDEYGKNTRIDVVFEEGGKFGLYIKAYDSN